MTNYAQICFVIMPFGKKLVGDTEVDFDRVYDTIFVPAISGTQLPEGGKLDPRRTDKDFFSGDINMEMFSYLEYSRFAVADITGLNANVFYELGARHRTRDSGTAIFRQANAPIPFDIQTIKAFPYEYEPAAKVEEARALIRKVLSESLVHNRLDSPIRLVLDRQLQQSAHVQERLKDAENAIRKMDPNAAMQIYKEIIALDRSNPLHRIKLGMLQKERGLWNEAINQFNGAVDINGSLAEAWREKGIAENKLAFQMSEKTKTATPANPAPGEPDLRRATELNDSDFDAQSSLGGVLKRAKRYDEAWQCYIRAREVSGDHPYPLLNEIKLRAFRDNKLDLTSKDRRALKRAKNMRKTQAGEDPPYDSPWCFFDLAEIKLYEGDADDFIKFIDRGIENSTADWQPNTFLESLRLLEPAAQSLPGLDKGIELLK
jgi:tetratricopeptide (TPR) repeat protein